MRTDRGLVSLLVPLLTLACSENPVALEDDHEEELTVALTMSPDHVHTLAEITFTARVTDHHGAAFMDFEVLQLERRMMGDPEWRPIEMTRMGDAYMGTYTFMSSGEYDIRVMGQRHGHGGMLQLHAMAEPLHVGRAHVEAEGYRIEFESFPGHLHEGETATVKFWVMRAEADGSGVRPPVTGLDAEIHCEESNGMEEHHHAVELVAGVYQAEHTFAEAGEAHLELKFTQNGTPVAADFHVPVAHAH